MYRKLVLWALCLLFVPALCGATPMHEQFEQANTSYTNSDFEAAIEGYTTLLENYQQESPSIYYNLGNAYFEIDRFGMAVWCFERALRRQPSPTLRSNAEFNLERAREEAKEALRKRGIERHHVFERQSSISELVLGLVEATTTAWILAVGWALLFLLLFLKKWNILSSSRTRNLMLPVALMVFLAALWTLVHMYKHTDSPAQGDESMGVVVTNTQLRSGLENDADTESIPDGLTIDILDDSHEEYFRVSLFDGTEGWILKSAIKEI